MSFGSLVRSLKQWRCKSQSVMLAANGGDPADSDIDSIDATVWVERALMLWFHHSCHA